MLNIPSSRTPQYSLPPAEGRDFLFQEQETVNFRDYWSVVLKYRWSIVTCTFLIVFIAVVALVAKSHTYTATATLSIETQAPNVLGVLQPLATGGASFDVGGHPGLVDFYYKTQLNLLESRSLVARVIHDLGFDQDAQFKTYAEIRPSWLQHQWHQAVRGIAAWGQGLSLVQWFEARWKPEGKEHYPETFELGVHPKLIDTYLKRLNIGYVTNSQIVKVGFTSLDPSFSKKVANAHAETFIRTSLSTRFELTAGARQYLEERLAEIKIQVAKSEEELYNFRKTHAIVGNEKGENLLEESLKGLNDALTQARSRRIELESLYRVVQQRDNQLLSQIIDNAFIQRLKEHISTLELEYTRMATTFKPSHPSVIAVQQQLGQAKNRLDQEVRRIVRSIASDYNAAKAREVSLTDAMEKERQSALNLREKAVEAAILEREVESNRTLYETVLKRAKETDLTGEVPLSNIRLVDRADIPLEPDNPNRLRILVLSVIIGCLGGVGLAFLRHQLDNTLKTPDEVGRFLRLPTLGMVPNIKLLEKYARALDQGKRRALPKLSIRQGEQKQRLMLALPPSSVANESYQTICTALKFSLPERPPRTLLITSAQPKEGKTTTAINIAQGFARTNAPVLLIDADLRNGNCHKLLGLQNGSGLTNALTGNLIDNDCIKPTAIKNLFLLSRGDVPPNPADLLGSDRMRQLLDTLETKFAYIIIDSAPLMPITDTVQLATKVDGVVLVIRGQEGSRHVARQALTRLDYVKAKVLGVVLNNINIRGPEYTDYRTSYTAYYNAYYSYNGAELES
jgi:capsular exopolysaccharide synthesis family protein